MALKDEELKESIKSKTQETDNPDSAHSGFANGVDSYVVEKAEFVGVFSGLIGGVVPVTTPVTSTISGSLIASALKSAAVAGFQGWRTTLELQLNTFVVNLPEEEGVPLYLGNPGTISGVVSISFDGSEDSFDKAMDKTTKAINDHFRNGLVTMPGITQISSGAIGAITGFIK